MKTLLLLPLLLVLLPGSQTPAPTQQDSLVVVLGFKWSRARQIVEKVDSAPVTPAREVIADNKNYQRNARVNDPAGKKDPNEDTIDGRSAALEKNVQAARTPMTKPVDGFAYRARVQNASTKVIEIVFWEYQFIDPSNPATMTRHQFLCGVKVKPEKALELQAFSVSSPSDVVSVSSMANNSDNVFQEKVLINRVEYADGSIWQRKAWNFGEIRMTYKRAIATPWGSEMCRGL